MFVDDHEGQQFSKCDLWLSGGGSPTLQRAHEVIITLSLFHCVGFYTDGTKQQWVNWWHLSMNQGTGFFNATSLQLKQKQTSLGKYVFDEVVKLLLLNINC